MVVPVVCSPVGLSVSTAGRGQAVLLSADVGLGSRRRREGRASPVGAGFWGRADEVPVTPFILEETAPRAWALGPGLRPMCLRYWVEECGGAGSPRPTEPWVGPGGPTNYRAGSPGNPGCA